MNEAFIQWLSAVFGIQSSEQLQQLVQQLGEQGLQQLAQVYKQYPDPAQAQQIIASSQQQAKFGRQLRYYNDIMQRCNPGEKVVYKKLGGTLCKTCEQPIQEVPKPIINKPRFYQGRRTV